MRAIPMILLVGYVTLAFSSTRTISRISDDGEMINTEFSNHSVQQVTIQLPDPPEVIWHYSTKEGPTVHNCDIGFNSGFVLAGYSRDYGKMFTGIDGDGNILWTTEPLWSPLCTATAAAKTADIFYVLHAYDDNTSISRYGSSSSAPVWTYSGIADLFNSKYSYQPEMMACSDDGSVLAAGGKIDGHLAILFFNSSSSTPFSIYEDTTLSKFPTQLRITADGSKCIFRSVSVICRIDVATAALEASCPTDAISNCFAISPDGSTVAYGFSYIKVLKWDGSVYKNAITTYFPGYIARQAAIASDNSTIYYGLTNNYIKNRIARFDISSSTPLWTYDYPVCSGNYQDLISWVDCSDDGRWLVVGSWGCDAGGGDEIQVFDDKYHSAPVFTINTSGSIYHAVISPDGKYIAAVGKSVHANKMGSGSNIYFAEIDVMGIEEIKSSNPLNLQSISPNPVIDRMNVNFSIPQPGNVTIEIIDIRGRMVQELSHMHMSAGTFNLSFSTDLNNGIYFCRVVSGEETSTGKFVVAR